MWSLLGHRFHPGRFAKSEWGVTDWSRESPRFFFIVCARAPRIDCRRGRIRNNIILSAQIKSSMTTRRVLGVSPYIDTEMQNNRLSVWTPRVTTLMYIHTVLCSSSRYTSWTESCRGMCLWHGSNVLQENKWIKQFLEEEQKSRKELERLVRKLAKQKNDCTWEDSSHWTHPHCAVPVRVCLTRSSYVCIAAAVRQRGVVCLGILKMCIFVRAVPAYLRGRNVLWQWHLDLSRL